MKIENFEDMVVWKDARVVANRLYDLTAKREFSRDFVLRDQIRRAAVSIISNIAEGFERNGNKEFIHFLYVAKGSCGEVRCQLSFASDRGYITKSDYDRLCCDLLGISRQLSGLIKYLRQSDLRGSKYS